MASAGMHQKRKPFGAVDGNVRRVVAEGRSSSGDHVRKSKSKSASSSQASSHATSSYLKQGIRGTNPTNQQFNAKAVVAVEQRRDSKTPKMSNLSAIGGAYEMENLRDDDLRKPRKGGGGGKPKEPNDAARHGLDPSPLKLPDPIATVSSTSNMPLTTSMQHQNQSKSKPRDGTDTEDRFVSTSLKRLFQSNIHSSEDQTAKPSVKSQQCSVSSKVAPPLVKHSLKTTTTTSLDPVAKDVTGIDADEVLGTMQAISRASDHQQRASSSHVRATSDVQPPRTERTQPMITQKRHGDQPAETNLNELLDRARSGPTDNKRVLDAMLTSGCGRRTLGPDPTVGNEASMESIVIGSIIGGKSLKRSKSADESEVTTMDYTLDSSSQASMTTCFDHHRTSDLQGGIVVAPHPIDHNIPCISSKHVSRGSVPSIFRTTVPTPLLPPPSSQAMHSYPTIHRANAITDTTTCQPNELNSTAMFQSHHLPAGWKERWSNSKQKPYWVHPDFGSTWHCPGLIVNDGYETRRNEVVYHADRGFQTMALYPGGNLGQSSIPVENGTTTTLMRQNDHNLRSCHDTHHAERFHRTEQFTQNGPTTLSSGANEGETHHLNGVGGQHQSHMASSAQVSEWNDVDNNMTNTQFNQDSNNDGQANYTAKCLDGSSADVSSSFLTQDFETKRDGSNDNGTEPVIDNVNDEVEYDNHYASLGEEEHDNVKTRFDATDHDEVGGQTNGTVADEHSEVSDEEETEINTIVKHGRTKYTSPLATINEFLRGSGCQSSEVSLDDDDDSINNDDIAGSNASPNLSPKPSFEDSSVNDSDGKSAPVDDGDIGFDKTDMSPDNNWGSSNHGGFESDDNDVDVAPKEKSKSSSSHSRGDRKKKTFFPPGPLCSLQFLEEIENNEFDTPLWRRMKRKRSTLSSVKAQKARQRAKQRRATLS